MKIQNNVNWRYCKHGFLCNDMDDHLWHLKSWRVLCPTSAIEKGKGSKSHNKQKKITIFCSINSKFLIFLCCLLQWLSNICRIQFNMPWKFGFPLKLLSAIIYQIFIFYQMIALEKLWKMLFMSSKKLFLLSKYSIFLCFHPALFFSLLAIALEDDRR